MATYLKIENSGVCPVEGFVLLGATSKRLADNALVALTLLIAESRPDEKDTIVKVVVNLINRKND